jgi:hypothetical protein
MKIGHAGSAARLVTHILLTIICGTVVDVCCYAQVTCPTFGSKAPPTSVGTAENSGHRTEIQGDYLVIEYNAQSHDSFWYDYHHFHDPGGRDEIANKISRNASFLPVVYSREKIAVHVCNLHFTDQVSVATNPLTVPEGGADIRGTTPATPLPALTNTLDTLQVESPSGLTVLRSGVGFGTTSPVGTLTVSGVAPGSVSLGSGTPIYTSAQITVSGAQLAQLLYAFRQNADDLVESIQQTETSPSNRTLPGSLDAINKVLATLETKVTNDTASVSSYFHGSSPLPPDSKASASEKDAYNKFVVAAGNYGAFDEDVTAAQNLSAELTTLAGSLSAQGYGARAVTLQNNYEVFDGVMDFINLGLLQKNCSSVAAAAAPPAAKAPGLTALQVSQLTKSNLAELTNSELEAFSTAQIQSLTETQLSELNANQLRAVMKPRTDAPPSQPYSPDPPACSAFEKGKFEGFHNSYVQELSKLGESNSDQFETDTRASRQRMFDELEALKAQLGQIDIHTQAVFEKLNNWYDLSAVEQTDLLTPVSNNALMHISIAVQRGYTPFTLTDNPSATAPAPSAAPSSSSSAGAPAHTVKTVLIEVHRLANFNLAGGVMTIHVPTNSYSVVTSATPATVSPSNPAIYNGSCNGKSVALGGVPTTTTPTGGGAPITTYTAPTFSCITMTQQTDWQVAGMVGLSWYPWGRDYFPRRKGYTNYARNYAPSVLVASSITSFGSAFGGLNVEPFSGIDLFAGIASANRNVLPTGVAPNSAVATGYALPSTTQVHVGFSAGIAFDFGVFTQLFSKTTNPAGGLP